MGAGQSRPELFTETQCESPQGLIEALTCAICKDLMWAW